jgi:DNA anti-recombination protein RmuC
MKKIMIACVAAFFGFGTVAMAQERDTTSYTNERLEEAGDEMEEGVEEASDELQEGAESTEQELEQATEEMENAWDNSTDAAEDGVRESGEAIEEGAEEAGEAVEEGAEELGEETEEAADESNDRLEKIGKTGAAHIKDERIESKEGPEGETVFIDEHAQYYYINKQGERVNVDKSELKDKE